MVESKASLGSLGPLFERLTSVFESSNSDQKDQILAELESDLSPIIQKAIARLQAGQDQVVYAQPIKAKHIDLASLKYSEGHNTHVPTTILMEYPSMEQLQNCSVEQLDSMQLHKIINHKGRWQFNFAVNNLEPREMSKSYMSLKTYEVQPKGALISKILTYNKNKDDMLAGIRFYSNIDGEETTVLEAGCFDSSGCYMRAVEIAEDERVIGVKGKTYEHDPALFYDLQFMIVKFQ